MPQMPRCYGGLFSATLTRTPNQEVKGKVFGYRIDHHGVVESGRTVTAGPDAWLGCTRCADLDSCFRLSVGKLLMEIALRN